MPGAHNQINPIFTVSQIWKEICFGGCVRSK